MGSEGLQMDGPSIAALRGTDVPKKTAEILERLSAHRKEQVVQLQALLTAGQTGNRSVLLYSDMVVIAAVQRSVSLILGFCTLLPLRNYQCAGPLVRLQIDSILRLNACSLTDEVEKVTEHLLTDRPLKQLKARSGEQMTDRFLQDSCAKRFPWISGTYKSISGMIHLSGWHIAATFPERSKDAGGWETMHVGFDGPKVEDRQLLELAWLFSRATAGVDEVCRDFLARKLSLPSMPTPPL